MYTPSARDVEDRSILEHGGVSAIKQEPAKHVRFYIDKIQDLAASEQEGRPIYKDQEFVEIFAQGGSSTVIKKVTEQIRAQYHIQYTGWKAGQEETTAGMPLEKWPHALMSPSMIANLKYFQIYSVEQLSEMTDGTIQKVGMGAIKLREDAREYLQRASGVEPKIEALKQENTELTERLSAMEKQLEALSKPKQGRKRKIADEPINDSSSDL